MKRAPYTQPNRQLRPWVAELARTLIERGTVARRLLEADLDGWVEPLSSPHGEVLSGSSQLEARIRTLFTGLRETHLTSPALNGSFLTRGRDWR